MLVKYTSICALFPGLDQDYRIFFLVYCPGAPKGSTGRVIFVVVFGEACAYFSLQSVNNSFLVSEVLVFAWCVKSIIREFGH